MMNVLYKSASGTSQIEADAKLLSERKVFVDGVIDSAAAIKFTKEIMILNLENPDKPIDVYINSPGGDVVAGLEMYDVIQTSNAHIRLFCVGAAYSMGAVLFASGRHGRYMLPHSELMLHEPTVNNNAGGSSSYVRNIYEKLMKVQDTLNQIIVAHTGKSVDEVKKMTESDHYFSAEESIKAGLCDEIVGFSKFMEA